MELLTIFYAVLAATLGLNVGADRANMRPVAVASAPSAAAAVAPDIIEAAASAPSVPAVFMPALRWAQPHLAVHPRPYALAVRTIFARRHE